jgi:hypothetical protein
MASLGSKDVIKMRMGTKIPPPPTPTHIRERVHLLFTTNDFIDELYKC